MNFDRAFVAVRVHSFSNVNIDFDMLGETFGHVYRRNLFRSVEIRLLHLPWTYSLQCN